MTITKDADSFTDSINAVLNPDLRRETMRLRDPVGWRVSSAEPTVIPDRADDVPSELLPVCS
jgi:hypothetical protein